MVVVAKALLLVFSPTRAIIDHLKKPGGTYAANLIRKWNIGFFCLAVVSVAALQMASVFAEIKPLPYNLHFLFVWLLPFSRCNELVYAFYHDSFQQLSPISIPRTNLTLLDRVTLLLRSYIEIAINFGVIHFALPGHMYFRIIKSPIEATYFSVVTIATVGYGDIVPVDPVSQLLCTYEVFAGFFLIVFAFAVYVSAPREISKN